jgi:C4-dicarboxylate transporter/malic acid transport protein.
VLATLLDVHLNPMHRLEFNFIALSLWLWGGMLYIWIIVLIFYRYSFFPLTAKDLVPPYWINMGAMAISTLAGSLLIVNAAKAPYLHSLLPFLKGFTVFYWATGSWWIPLLVTLELWRHGIKRLPIRYDPLYWGVVFPLGMYSLCTISYGAEHGSALFAPSRACLLLSGAARLGAHPLRDDPQDGIRLFFGTWPVVNTAMRGGVGQLSVRPCP